MYGKNVGGYYYHPVWNLQFQEYLEARRQVRR